MDADAENWTEPTYEQLKKFFKFYSEQYLHVETVPSDKRPIASLEALERTRPKAAAVGLRQAVNDCIEAAYHFKNLEIEALDKQLRSIGIIIMSELRRLYSKQYRTIISRGHIKNETEWYMMRNVLHDPTPKPSSEISLLQSMISDYEVQ